MHRHEFIVVTSHRLELMTPARQRKVDFLASQKRDERREPEGQRNRSDFNASG
jgi:hypothetical protein